MDIQNCNESQNNYNDQTNEHIIIVPETQNVLNPVKENVSNPVKDIFFFMTKVQQKPTNRKTDYSS